MNLGFMLIVVFVILQPQGGPQDWYLEGLCLLVFVP